MALNDFIRLALRLARRGYGTASPNPMVGAVLVKGGKIIGHGWHRRAGRPHAEIEALQDAHAKGNNPRGATLYVTLEPCSTHGRTPPCTDAIIAAGIKRVVIGATDPNPKHSGKGFAILKRAGVAVEAFGGKSPSPRPSPPVGERVSEGRMRGRVHARDKAIPNQRNHLKVELQTLAVECERLNEAFNHWIVHRTPFVTVKAAMTLDGKIATARGESKWITGGKARADGMKLRRGSDAILIGINTILADDPSLTVRSVRSPKSEVQSHQPRRVILDSLARTPLKAKVVSDKFAALTTIVVSKRAPKVRVAALAKRVNILVAPLKNSALLGVPKLSSEGGRTPWGAEAFQRRRPHSALNLRWLLKKLGAQNVTSLLVEGGGEVNASFLLGGQAQRVVFFYAPKILGGRDARKGVSGEGIQRVADLIRLRHVEWKRLGPDLRLTGRVG